MLVRYVVLIAVMLLTACVGNQPLQVNEDPEARLAALQRLNAFRVTGGLSAWTDKESIASRLEWDQLGNDFDILLSLPANIRTVRITQQGGFAELRNGGSPPVRGPSAAQLLEEALGLGIAIPIEQMALWIKGLPGEGSQNVIYDKQRRLKSMEYRDSQSTLWRTQILRYSVFQNVYVPSIIVANGGPFNIRLVLRNWSAKAPTSLAGQGTGNTTGGSTRLQVPGR